MIRTSQPAMLSFASQQQTLGSSQKPDTAGMIQQQSITQPTFGNANKDAKNDAEQPTKSRLRLFLERALFEASLIWEELTLSDRERQLRDKGYYNNGKSVEIGHL